MAGRRREPGLDAPGLGDSRSSILSVLKRLGGATISELASRLDLNVETVREHVKILASRRLVRREGARSSGPGRPDIVYSLTSQAEKLFPRREGELLRELAVHLRESGHEALLGEFFDRLVERRRTEALSRVAKLEGRARLEEAATILSEQGFMAIVEESAGRSQLRLCHCPYRELVEETTIPCRAEIGFVRELIGESLARVRYIPAGDASCSYEAGEAS